MAKANARPRDRAADEAGAFPILEAVFVAVLIITTIIFFTSLQRPTTGTDVGGIDLGRLASDTLEILQTKEFTRANCLDAVGLEQWVGLVLNGTTCVSTQTGQTFYVADEIEAFLSEVLPPGTQFLVRLDNGIAALSSPTDLTTESLVLVPNGATDTPRAARAASTYITPAWNDFRGKTGSQFAYPGQQVAASQANATAFAGRVAPDGTVTAPTILCIESPSGSSIGPGGVTWKSVWQPTPTTGRIPNTIPYGTWAGYGNAACSGSPSTYLHVGLPDGTATDYPIHALQLVVWFGA